ncbi:hypothetical protein [Nitrosomonas sp. Nm33]|uniref:hypothetical protein n=1 Tax=Nitrosomonas sp. Nm33 TaxID=133724 RepID=UPI0008968D79|nr:hypothetical protein [Nitrosomonas sp. Nm33]SDY44112.1 hypothetical protein SAMN05421755_102236 [Nitrosomonas sp. Nm33]
MKIGPVEGTPEEVNNFFQNNGLNPLDYFQKPEPALQKRWLIIPSVLFVVSFTVLVFVTDEHTKIRIMLFLFGFCSSLWLAVSIHIRFKSAWGSGSIILAGLLIMLVALGVLKPEQIPSFYQGEAHNKQVKPTH